MIQFKMIYRLKYASLLILPFLLISCGSSPYQQTAYRSPSGGEKSISFRNYQKINSARRAKGLSTLKYSTELEQIAMRNCLKNARVHAQTKNDRDATSHSGADFRRAEARKAGYVTMGENAAWFYSRTETDPPARFHKNLVNSKFHFQNMLKKEYTHVGVATVVIGDDHYLIETYGTKGGLVDLSNF